MEKHEYRKLRESSLNAPKQKIEISDEDLLRKIAEYVEQAYYVFEKKYQEHINKFTNFDKNEFIVKKLIKAIAISPVNEIYEATEIFKFIVDLRGYHELPKIVSDEEFAKQQKNSTILYRGSKTKFIIDLLAKVDDNHYGYGSTASGIYASPSKDFAFGYGAQMQEDVLKFLVSGKGIDIKILNYSLMFADDKIKNELVEMFKGEDEIIQKRVLLFYNTYQKLPKTIKKYVNNAIKSDLSLLGLFLGYDYIMIEKFGNSEVCVLNRAAMVVPQSEYDKFVKNTKYETDNGKTFEQVN